MTIPTHDLEKETFNTRRQRREVLETRQKAARRFGRFTPRLRSTGRPAFFDIGETVRRFIPKAVLAGLGAVLLLTSYLLPAYASVPLTNPVAATAVRPSQSLSAPAGGVLNNARRDPFMVTRTTLSGYQPYAHLANTFANNPNSSVQWPFEVGVPISSWFGFRSCDGCSADHQGIDLNPGEGTPIEAIADGVVTEIGNPNGSWGVYAMIAHQIGGQNVTSLYAHMLQGSLDLSVGQAVTKGQLVGQVGSTGQSTGPHLHFGIYLNGVTAIDPYAWMKEVIGS